MKLDTPIGYDKMVEVFGDIKPYIDEDGTVDSSWENKILSLCELPYPLILSWNKKQTVLRFRCHYLLVESFYNVFMDIYHEDLQAQSRYFGGCYNFRAKRGQKKLSTHCWGIALDLNPDTNQMGKVGDQNQRVIEIFQEYGFVWGGEFNDPMHFAFVKGY